MNGTAYLYAVPFRVLHEIACPGNRVILCTLHSWHKPSVITPHMLKTSAQFLGKVSLWSMLIFLMAVHPHFPMRKCWCWAYLLYSVCYLNHQAVIFFVINEKIDICHCLSCGGPSQFISMKQVTNQTNCMLHACSSDGTSFQQHQPCWTSCFPFPLAMSLFPSRIKCNIFWCGTIAWCSTTSWTMEQLGQNAPICSWWTTFIPTWLMCGDQIFPTALDGTLWLRRSFGSVWRVPRMQCMCLYLIDASLWRRQSLANISQKPHPPPLVCDISFLLASCDCFWHRFRCPLPKQSLLASGRGKHCRGMKMILIWCRVGWWWNAACCGYMCAAEEADVMPKSNTTSMSTSLWNALAALIPLAESTQQSLRQIRLCIHPVIVWYSSTLSAVLACICLLIL